MCVRVRSCICVCVVRACVLVCRTGSLATGVQESGENASVILWGNCCASLSHFDGVAGNPRWPAASRLIYQPARRSSRYILPRATRQTQNSHRSNSSPLPPATAADPTAHPIVSRSANTAAAAATPWHPPSRPSNDYVTREDICRPSAAATAGARSYFFRRHRRRACRRGVYHNNVECMRNELIPRHRLIEKRVFNGICIYYYVYISYIPHVSGELAVICVFACVHASLCAYSVVFGKR